MRRNIYLATYIGPTGKVIDNGHETYILFYDKDYYVYDDREYYDYDSNHVLSIYSLDEGKYLGKLKYDYLTIRTNWRIKKHIP